MAHKRSHDHAFDHSAIPSPTPNRRETERTVGRTRDYPTMKRSDDFTVGETECLDVDRKPDTRFQFGYSDNPNSVCSFCGSTSGLFCLTKEAAAECSADAETVALRSKPRPMTREQVIERIAQAFKAESGEECERSLAEVLTWIKGMPETITAHDPEVRSMKDDIDEELRRLDRGSKAFFIGACVMTAITIIFAFLALGVGHHNGLIP